MTKIGFTGSRRGMTKVQKEKIKELFASYDSFELHHGDCVGADDEAHNIARKMEMAAEITFVKIVVHPPSDNKLRAYTIGDTLKGTKPYLNRNRDIVDETDFLIAFPNGHEGQGKNKRSGTWYTIRYARSVNKPVTIVYQNGNIDRLT